MQSADEVEKNPNPYPSKKKGAGKRRIGDNSVELLGVIDRVVLEYDLEPYTRSSFFVRAYDILRNYRQNVSWSGDVHGVVIVSLMSRRTGAGVQSALFRVEGQISRSLPPLSQVRVVLLINGLPVQIGEIPLANIAAILTGQNVNMRLFEARVAALLNPNARTMSIIRMHMSQYFDFGRIIHRMDTVYIKLLYYALIRQRFIVEGLVPVLPPFQVNNNYVHFNTRPDVDWDEAEIQSFKNAHCSGFLSFIYNKDYNPNDRIFYKILGSPAPYFAQPANQRVIPALHWVLPAIDVMSIAPAPAIEIEPHDISPGAFFEFARRTAVYRGETQTFMRALYYVSELIHAEALPVPMDQPNMPGMPEYYMHL